MYVTFFCPAPGGALPAEAGLGECIGDERGQEGRTAAAGRNYEEAAGEVNAGFRVFSFSFWFGFLCGHAHILGV